MLARQWQHARERSDAAPSQRVAPQRWLLLAVTSMLAAGIYLQLRAGMLARLPLGGDTTVGLLDNPLRMLPPLPRIASGFLGWAHGLALTLWPHDLCCDYGPDRLPVVRELASALGVAGFAVGGAFVCGLGLALRHARRHPLPALAIAAGVLATQLRTARARHVGLAVLALWLGSSIAVAVPRNFVWADDATLLDAMPAASPR